MSNLSDQEIQSTLHLYGFSPSGSQCEAIRTYIPLLLRWNERISLTTVVDPHEVLRFHFGESLFVATSVGTEKGRLADVGSGAGFPGLPLKIAAPELSITLIESNAKKAAFLAEVVRVLNLNRVDIVRKRMEEIPMDVPQFDFLTARALGGYIHFLTWSRARLTSRGRVILWLGDEDCKDISAVASWSWGDPVLIPGSKRRFVLMGSPAS